MAGSCGRTYRIDPRVDPAACNALQDGPSGLLVPEVQLVADPGLRVTPPADGACPQVWRVGMDGAWGQVGGTGTHAVLESTPPQTWEAAPELGTVAVPRSGPYEITAAIRGYINNGAGGTPVSCYVSAGVSLNGVLFPFSETMPVGGDLVPGEVKMGTGNTTFLVNLTAGDVLGFIVKRFGDMPVPDLGIVSNEDGRSRITAVWLGPVGDTGL